MGVCRADGYLLSLDKRFAGASQFMFIAEVQPSFEEYQLARPALGAVPSAYHGGSRRDRRERSLLRGRLQFVLLLALDLLNVLVGNFRVAA